MNENKKTKALVEELENEFPSIYDRINYGLYVLVIDENGKIYDDESEPDFNENDIDEVQVIYSIWIMYKRNAVAINREDLIQNHFRITTDDYIRLEDLEELTKIVNIVAKHLVKINFKAHL